MPMRRIAGLSLTVLVAVLLVTGIAFADPAEAEKVKVVGQVAVSFSQQTGNADLLGTSIDASAGRKTKLDNLTGRALWNYAEDHGLVTARNTYGAIKYDRSFSKDWYGYVSDNALSDRFRDLDLRNRASGGVGFHAVEKDDRFVHLEAGVAYITENFRVARTHRETTARLALNMEWPLGPALTFTDDLELYPETDGGEYQARNEAGLANALGGGWSLRLSNVTDYNSAVHTPTEQRDMLWLLSIQYKF